MTHDHLPVTCRFPGTELWVQVLLQWSGWSWLRGPPGSVPWAEDGTLYDSRHLEASTLKQRLILSFHKMFVSTLLARTEISGVMLVTMHLIYEHCGAGCFRLTIIISVLCSTSASFLCYVAPLILNITVCNYCCLIKVYCSVIFAKEINEFR